jgi:hypothetical protein
MVPIAEWLMGTTWMRFSGLKGKIGLNITCVNLTCLNLVGQNTLRLF